MPASRSGRGNGRSTPAGGVGFFVSFCSFHSFSVQITDASLLIEGGGALMRVVLFH